MRAADHDNDDHSMMNYTQALNNIRLMLIVLQSIDFTRRCIHLISLYITWMASVKLGFTSPLV